MPAKCYRYVTVLYYFCVFLIFLPIPEIGDYLCHLFIKVLVGKQRV
jgi:hypothetical protein